METVFAYTEQKPEPPYPAYVSLLNHNGRYILCVRSEGHHSAASIELSETKLTELAISIIRKVGKPVPE